MVLEEEIEKLNTKYSSHNIKFTYNKELNRIIIEENYVISSNIVLKEELKTLYSIIFDWDKKYWYIDKLGIDNLSNKIKLAPSINLEDLKKLLFDFIEMINDSALQTSLKNVLENHPNFFEAPAAIYFHHNYKGGLLEHTVQTCKVALAIADNINNELVIDKDLLIAGSILHDIGKINCYVIENDLASITKIMKEQDHIVNGIKIVSQEMNVDKIDEIIHIIASHHNIKDWGSPVEPSSNEAWIIHFSENLSSKILG